MTTPRQLRVLVLYLSIGASLAFSCAREENGLDPSGSGGSSAIGGTSSAAGSKATAGSKAVAGSASAFGGASGVAGSSTGGKSSTAGTSAGGDAATGGVAGTGGAATGGKVGAAGGGGSGGVPPDVLENADVIVYYETSHATASDKTIQMKLRLVNQSADPLPLANVKIRYWFTAEATPTLHQYYVGPSIKGPAASFVSDAGSSHALLTFTGSTVVKGADLNASEIQLEMNGATAFDQADDFSWDPTASTATPNAKITLYLADVLVWGCEPSGECAENGAGTGGAPGAGGASGGDSGVGGAP